MVRISVLFLSCFLFSTFIASAQEAQNVQIQDAQIKDAQASKETYNGVLDKLDAIQEENQLDVTLDPTMPKNNAMQFSLVKDDECAQCILIAAEGSISSETPDVFIDFIEQNAIPAGATIFLHSNGGDLLAAMTLGKIIRDKGFNTNIVRTMTSDENDKTVFTYEQGYCANACLWAYLGGRERSLNTGSVVELKTYRPPLDEAGTISGLEAPSRKQQLIEIAYIDDYSKLMGFNRDIIFTDWQNSDPHRFTIDEMSSNNIAYSPNNFEPWYLLPDKGGLIAQTNTKDNQKIVQFYCDARSQKIVEIILPFRIDEAVLDNLQKEQVYLSVFGKKIKLDKKQFSYNENNTLWKAKLTRFDPSTVLEDQYNIVLNNAGEAHYLDHFRALEIQNFVDLTSFKTMSKLALHSCIVDE